MTMPGGWIVLMVVLPATLVLLASIWAQKALQRAFDRNAAVRESVEARKISTPIRLQAYERLALFLERISPELLLLQIDSTGMDVAEFRAVLLETLRSEWSHNLSQQIYVSKETWDRVRQARGAVSQLITLCGEKVHDEAPAVELSRIMLASLIELDAHPTNTALEALREEASQLFH